MNEKFDVAIIGGGTAGMTAWRAARAHTDSVVLIEGGHWGTTCARVGCMPSKLLIAAAEAAESVREAPGFGVHADPPRIDGRAVMQRVRSERDRFVGFVLDTIKDIPAAHKIERRVRFTGPHTLRCDDGREIEAARIVIATGSRPRIPEFLAPVADRVIVNDDVFAWTGLPESVAVFGAGVIGLELGQALHRLGVRVRIFGRSDALANIGDPAVRDGAARHFCEMLPLSLRTRVLRIAAEGSGVQVEYDDGRGRQLERFDCALAASGRLPNLDELGLDAAGLSRADDGTLPHNRHSAQCAQPHIFIAGDASDELQLLHEAADEGQIAGDNAGRYPDIRSHPRRAGIAVVFSEPQVAMVGGGYRAAVAAGAPFAVGEVSFENQGRSRVLRQNHGLMRVYGEHGSGRFLGAEICGPRAEHLAHLLAWARQQQMTVPHMLEMPYYHPVIEEGLRTALRHLDRSLHMGPAPTPPCLSDGPGT